jgi:hypothetical protein
METVKCYCCDEFQLRGKAETGYCNEYNLPTWKSVVKKCQEYVRAEWGEFCYDHCPFRCDFDCGEPCGEQSPSVTSIHNCPELQSRMNEALGGRYETTWYTLNKRGEIVENYVSICHGCESLVDSDLTRDYRWNVGWQRYYPEVGNI